jgi:hypothetical protein
MTHTKDEALLMALAKIKSARCCHPNAVQELIFEAEEILEQAPAAPVQEPIYQLQMMDGKWIDQAKQSYEYNKAHGNTVRIVYTAAQPAPAPLTRERIKEICAEAGYATANVQARVDFINGIRHGEAAHGITAAPEKGQS